jgi:hypothetical protein
MPQQSERKTCSICGKSFSLEHFNYGNRPNRSHCQSCNQLEQATRSQGGTEAARAFREEMRQKWVR